MHDALILLVGAALGLGLGWLLHATVAEIRHDCLPHEPIECRREDTDAG